MSPVIYYNITLISLPFLGSNLNGSGVRTKYYSILHYEIVLS